jgi:hypothetical protein
MDKRRIRAMLPAVSVPVPVAACGEGVASRRGAGRIAARRTRLAAAQRALLSAREPSLRAIRNDSPLPRLAVHAGVGLTRRLR